MLEPFHPLPKRTPLSLSVKSPWVANPRRSAGPRRGCLPGGAIGIQVISGGSGTASLSAARQLPGKLFTPPFWVVLSFVNQSPAPRQYCARAVPAYCPRLGARGLLLPPSPCWLQGSPREPWSVGVTFHVQPFSHRVERVSRFPFNTVSRGVVFFCK